MEPILGPHYDPGLIDSRGRLTRFCKGQKAPEQTSQQKRNERLQEQLLVKQLKQGEMKFPEMPTPPPVLPAPPPPTATSADTIEAGRYAKKQAGKRTNTGTGTIFAGNTGGYKAAGLGGQKTLLG